jgi:hypothetical protein
MVPLRRHSTRPLCLFARAFGSHSIHGRHSPMNVRVSSSWWWPWGAPAAALLGGGALAAWNLALRAQSPSAVPVKFGMQTTMIGLSLWFGIYTYRRLGQLCARQSNAVVVQYGVRWLGVSLAVTSTLWPALEDFTPLTGATLASGEMWFRLAISALLNIPLSLWAGYLGGRVMGTMIVIPKDR